jgi:hypothetical protein
MLMHRFMWMAAVATLAISLAPGAPAAAQEESGLEPLEIELPQPNYGGTPLNYYGPNLEPRSYKPREPFLAPPGTENVALGAKVTTSDPSVKPAQLQKLVDDVKAYQEEHVVELAPGVQYVQLDLGAPHALHAIVLWHYHESERVYFDTIIQVSNDPSFKEGVETVFNNDDDNSAGLGAGEDMEYVETYEGKLFDVGGVTGRYVRLYSNGNTTDDNNHYIEVAVYGQPE